MKNIFTVIAVIAVLTFVSCKEKQPDTDSTLKMPEPVEAVVSVTDSMGTENVQPMPAVPTTAKLNPAHGEPGHRCDIEVGAPLDGPATIPAMSAPAASPVMSAPAVLPGAVGSGRLNPPHGQPGHDCAVAVGAPLS